MQVKFSECFVIFVLFIEIKAKHVKSKPNNLEDFYESLASLDEIVQNDEVEYGLDDEEGITNENSDARNNVSINAEFRSRPQNFTVAIGETVRLPCEVNNSEVILLWQKDGKILYQGEVAFRTSPNIRKNGNFLEVKLNSQEDYGKYSCRMILSAEDNPVIIHTILQPTHPVITSLKAANGKRVYKTGETLELTCLAAGHPKPKISWHKDNKRLEMEGETLIIEDLKFKHSGIYRCLADNRIEPPAHYNITIKIQHIPIVSVEKYIVNSDKEYDVELKCIVHAYPRAIVNWKRNNINIEASPPKIQLKNPNGQENILIITNLTDEDFGKYNCSAVNSIGKTEEAIFIVKTPTILGKPKKMDKDVVVTWKVESKSPIIKHELQYKNLEEKEWNTAIPEITKDDKNIYTVKYALKNLEARDYEIKVRSQNVHGWSNYSDIISVNGDKQVVPIPDIAVKENERNKSPASTVQDSNASRCTLPNSSIAAISIIIPLIMLYYRQ